MRLFYRALLIPFAFLLAGNAAALNTYYFISGGTNADGSCGANNNTKRASSTLTCDSLNSCAGANAPLNTHSANDAALAVGTISSCYNKNNFSMGAQLTFKKLACPAGQEFSGTVCQPICPAGQSWNATTSQCEIDCPEGEIYDSELEYCREECAVDEMYYSELATCGPECTEPETMHSFVIGAENKVYCAIPLEAPPGPADCNDIAGYITDPNNIEHQICNDDKLACEATGGTYGMVNGEEVCLPSDYPEQLPTCDDGGVVILLEEGYICESPEPPDTPETPEVPGSEPPACPDIDEDGICNDNDGDIDGDGITNDVDTDDDGDGVPDGTDPSPEGETDAESSVSGGGSCESRPQCKGDAVACASLYQLWSIRCEDGSATLDGSGCGSTPKCEGKSWQCAVLLTDWRSKCAKEEGTAASASLDTYRGQNPVSRLDQAGDDIGDLADGVFNQGGTTGSCPAPVSVNVLGQSFTFSYDTACDAATSVRPFVLLGAGLIGAVILHKAF